MNSHFTYGHYADVLDRALRTHAFLTFERALIASIPRSIILRHDLDFSAEPAMRIAQMESDRGISACYFVLPSGPYEALVEPERGRIERLVALGHQLGLHFDPASYVLEGITPRDGIARDAKRLTECFQTPVTVASQHRPGGLPGHDLVTSAGLLDAYGPAFTRQRKYLSDSRQQWREACVCDAIRRDDWPHLQVLVHPIWWSEDGSEPPRRLSSFRTGDR